MVGQVHDLCVYVCNHNAPAHQILALQLCTAPSIDLPSVILNMELEARAFAAWSSAPKLALIPCRGPVVLEPVPTQMTASEYINTETTS